MAQAPKFSSPPTQAEIDRVIAQAHEMRAEYAAHMMRKLASALSGLLHRRARPSDLTT